MRKDTPTQITEKLYIAKGENKKQTFWNRTKQTEEREPKEKHKEHISERRDTHVHTHVIPQKSQNQKPYYI